uniref:Uncharacterized protein n=1 Tax=Mycena chlorophos TaxID=658473 RepID=A0ABQ0LU83_MYCCL|nr:predicted protein [Mycena chlorophos]
MSVSTYTHSSLAHLCVDPETFAHLTLPALSRVKLDLKWPTEDWSYAVDRLRRLVQRSDCALGWLWLQDDGRIQPRELQDLLSENPIRHLRLDFPHSARVKILMPILDLERVAPRLEHLEIWLQDGSGWESALALRPLKTRVKRSSRTLKSFKLHLNIEPGVVIPNNIPRQDLRRFRALVDAGLDVLVTASGGDHDLVIVTGNPRGSPPRPVPAPVVDPHPSLRVRAGPGPPNSRVLMPNIE